MDAMAAMGKAVKTVAPMMRGETAYDAKIVGDAARLFQQHAVTVQIQVPAAGLEPARPFGLGILSQGKR